MFYTNHLAHACLLFYINHTPTETERTMITTSKQAAEALALIAEAKKINAMGAAALRARLEAARAAGRAA